MFRTFWNITLKTIQNMYQNQFYLFKENMQKNLYFIELFNWKYINMQFSTIDWNVIKMHDTFSKIDLRESCNMVLNFDKLETRFLWRNDFFKSYGTHKNDDFFHFRQSERYFDETLRQNAIRGFERKICFLLYMLNIYISFLRFLNIFCLNFV